MARAPLTIRRWKRTEYDRLGELGVFESEPLELIGGQLIVAEPKGAYHSAAVTAVDYALRAALPAGWIVRTQQPLLLDDESEPEPDLAVVPGRPGDYRDAHPERPALAIEVAHSSLYFDREHKGSLFVNLVDRVVEIYRDPSPDPAAIYGWRYRSITTLAPPASVVPLAFASSHIPVADLLP